MIDNVMDDYLAMSAKPVTLMLDGSRTAVRELQLEDAMNRFVGTSTALENGASYDERHRTVVGSGVLFNCKGKPMLDPWIIDEILRREDERRREHEQGRAELPLNTPLYREGEPPTPTAQEDEVERGVVVIDI